MNIRKIIKETLLLEIGEANVEPFMWKLANKTDDFYIYEFKTAGGSNLNINVTFYKLSPKMMSNLVDRDRRLPEEAINLIKKILRVIGMLSLLLKKTEVVHLIILILQLVNQSLNQIK